MRMNVCDLDGHEAGLCCYLLILIEISLRPLQLFYIYLLTFPNGQRLYQMNTCGKL
jgi:hypothetical protein